MAGGAPLTSFTKVQDGIAYYFDRTGNYLGDLTAVNWNGNALVDDSTHVDRFGAAIACSDTHILVCSQYDDGSTTDIGSVYLYQIDGTFVTKTTTSIIFPASQAGASGLAMDANFYVVGMPLYLTNSGLVFVYDLTGTELFTIQNNDNAINDYFGWDLDIADGYIVVGAYGNSGVGAAYIFTDTTGTQMAKLNPVNPTSNMRFGYSVGVSNGKVVVGAPKHNGQGAVYVYSINGSFLFMIAGASDTLAGDDFGWAVDISDAQNQIIVGAPMYNTPTLVNCGAVYIFDATSGAELKRYYGTKSNHNYGLEVAISDTIAVVGTIKDSGFNGAQTGGMFLL